MIEYYKGVKKYDFGLVGNSDKIAAFDLDKTIINGNKVIPGVKEKLKTLTHKIVIITNLTKFDEDVFVKKMLEIHKELDVNFQVICCSTGGYSKKPSIGMWKYLESINGQINLENSFYVGDIFCKKGEDELINYKFSVNIKVKFYKTDEFFDETKMRMPRLIHPLKMPMEKSDEIVLEPNKLEVIILVGPPGCGKTKFANSIGYVVVENFKTRSKTLNYAEMYLIGKKSIIIDKKNENKLKRKDFIELGNKYKASVKIIWFDYPKDICNHLCAFREIVENIEVPNVVITKYYNSFEKPDECKVFRLCFEDTIKNNRDIFESFLI